MSQEKNTSESANLELLAISDLDQVTGGHKDYEVEIRGGIPGSVGPDGRWVPWVVFGSN